MSDFDQAMTEDEMARYVAERGAHPLWRVTDGGETIAPLPTAQSSLHAALARAQGKFPPIPKTSTVKTGSYSFDYAPLDAILDAVRPALAEEGLALTQPLDDRDGKTILVTQLLHADGGVLTSRIEIPNTQGRKMQEFGGALTYLRRYCITALLGIAAEDDDDADPSAVKEKTHRHTQPTRAASPRPAQSTGEVRADAPSPEPEAAATAPSPVASPEETKKAWIANWDSHTLAQINNAIPKMTADECREALVMEGEREMRGKGKPRNKTVTVALRDRIRTLEGSDGEPEAVAPVSQATTDGAAAPSDSEPGSPSVSPVLLVKAALAWIADQPQDVENANAWTTTGVLLGISQLPNDNVHLGTYASLDEVPAETLLWIFDEAIPDPVRDGVRRLGPEALAKLAEQAK